jgi:septal ring factor EnvC (AmiA/AmiB activator)
MLPDEQELHDIKLKVGLIERDVYHTNELCQRLSVSIEKIQELNTNIIQMMSLHGQRHEQHEKNNTKMEQDIKELHSRITTVSREIHERIDQVESHISSRIDDLRSDLITHKEYDKVSLKGFVAEVDKWKWMILGAVLTAGFLLGKIDITTLLTFLK